jgi:hypothetical protein
VGYRYRATDVIDTLDQAIVEYGYPKTIRVDNDPEFISKLTGYTLLVSSTKFLNCKFSAAEEKLMKVVKKAKRKTKRMRL